LYPTEGIDDIFQVNKLLLEQLEEKMRSWGPKQTLGDVLLKLVHSHFSTFVSFSLATAFIKGTLTHLLTPSLSVLFVCFLFLFFFCERRHHSSKFTNSMQSHNKKQLTC
jgi:predicted PurR-regulated permease PerM